MYFLPLGFLAFLPVMFLMCSCFSFSNRSFSKVSVSVSIPSSSGSGAVAFYRTVCTWERRFRFYNRRWDLLALSSCNVLESGSHMAPAEGSHFPPTFGPPLYPDPTQTELTRDKLERPFSIFWRSTHFRLIHRPGPPPQAPYANS